LLSTAEARRKSSASSTQQWLARREQIGPLGAASARRRGRGTEERESRQEGNRHGIRVREAR
jgi:hypothetical protein